MALLRRQILIFYSKIKLLLDLLSNLRSFFFKTPWVFVSENKDWSIYHDGVNLTSFLEKKGIKSWLTFNPHFVFRSCVHFGSINVFYLKYNKLVFKNNRIFVTFFHGYRGDDSNSDCKIDYLLDNLDNIETVIVSNSIMYKRLIEYGFRQDKLNLIPIPIDPAKFHFNVHAKSRKKFTIGSFQKDGVGWLHGTDPKYIKGPDILCNILKSLVGSIDFEVLLIGPARGYVINQLSAAGIDFKYCCYNNIDQVHTNYSKIDLYIMASREEGGPKSILECVASNVPILCTEVGMAVDVFAGMPNLISNFDTYHFKRKILEIYSGEISKYTSSYEDILRKYSWEAIIPSYLRLYHHIKDKNYD
jgi:glycosyltransferase involved in cell wall biosynthesis